MRATETRQPLFRRILAGLALLLLLTPESRAQKKNELGDWHYPYGFTLPESVYKNKKRPDDGRELLVWLPPEAKKIRAVLFIAPNTCSMMFGAMSRTKEVAAKHEMAVMLPRVNPNREPGCTPRILKFAAEQLKIPELEHAPIITYGKSSVGAFPYRAAWTWPDRVLATISFHAETLRWPVPPNFNLGDATIPNLNVNGELEWGGTWFVHVRPSLLNYRARTPWLPHQVVSWGVSHSNYPEDGSGKNDKTPRMNRGPVWDYMALYMDKMLTLRLPKEYPTDGPVPLRQIDPDKGYLVNPFAIETLLGLNPKPLVRGANGEYLVNADAGDMAATAGLLEIDPLKDENLRQGTPVSEFVPGKPLENWLTTGGLAFSLEPDPMLNLGELVSLRPAAGDSFDVDGQYVQFLDLSGKPSQKHGFSLGGVQVAPTTTVLYYTVVKVAQGQVVQVVAPFTPKGRVQVVLGGRKVAHGQVAALRPGLYPMLVVARLSTGWKGLKATLVAAPAEVAQKVREAKGAKGPFAANPRLKDLPLLVPASEVPAEARRDMLWMADKEMAEAWFALHARHGQTAASWSEPPSFEIAEKLASEGGPKVKALEQDSVAARAAGASGADLLALVYGDKKPAPPATREEAVRRTREALEAELKQRGGTWEAWSKQLEPYRDDIRNYIEDHTTYKWPWPAKFDFRFDGSEARLHLLEDLETVPEGQRPLEAIVKLDRELRKLGIDMIVAIIPAKLSICPDYLYAAVPGERRPARVPEHRDVAVATKRLLYGLAREGVEVVDLHKAFADYRGVNGDKRPLYYAGDNHYMNRGARLAAALIAERLQRYDFVREAQKQNPYVGLRGARGDGRKADPDVLLIRTKQGGNYGDAKDSPIVICGDSHLWYNSHLKAHISGQIAKLIGMPLSVIWKEGLARDIPLRLASDPGLSKRRVVILHYTERMIVPRKSTWPMISLGGPEKVPETVKVARLPARATVQSVSEGPDPKAAYAHYVLKLYVKNLVDAKGNKIGTGDGVIHVLAMHNRKILPVASAKAGDELKASLTSWNAVEDKYGSIQSGTLEDVELEIHKPLYWADIEGQPKLTDAELSKIGQEDDR